VLEAAGVREAYLVVIAVSGKVLAAQILSLVKHLNPEAQILVRVHYFSDCIELKWHSLESIVVSEAETSKSMIQRALEIYGLEAQSIKMG
jgi:hypothetical protein